MSAKSQSSYWAGKYPIREVKVHSFARKLTRMLDDGRHRTILDLGCGFGWDSLHFARKGHRVTAVDFSSESMRKLQEGMERFGLQDITILKKDLSRPLPFRDGSFDVVYAHLSAHYFDDRTTQKIFDEIHRVLKKGGLCFIKCKSTDDPLCGQGEKVGENMYMREHLRHFFTKEYMREKLHRFSSVSIKKPSSDYDGLQSAFIEAVATK